MPDFNKELYGFKPKSEENVDCPCPPHPGPCPPHPGPRPHPHPWPPRPPKFEQKDFILTHKLNNVIYELMVKTTANMVYINDTVTLTETLSDIFDKFIEIFNKHQTLEEAFGDVMEGAPETFRTFKEVWDYVNINGDPESELIKLIKSKQDAEEGKGLSTHDLTDLLYEKLVNGYTAKELDDKFDVVLTGLDETNERIVTVADELNDKVDTTTYELKEMIIKANQALQGEINATNEHLSDLEIDTEENIKRLDEKDAAHDEEIQKLHDEDTTLFKTIKNSSAVLRTEIGKNTKAIADLDEKVDRSVDDINTKIDSSVENLENEIKEVAEKPNIIVAKSTPTDIPDYSCWYQIITKD